MMNHDSKRPVTLEDILRLKRAERPPAEFWTQFDRELRAKQLAALVEKRPWWRTLSFAPVLTGLRRFHLPLGAAAVLAVTIFSVRGYHPASPSSAPASVVAAMPAPESEAKLVSTVTPAPVAVAAPAESQPVASNSSAVAVAEPADSSAHFVLSSDATPAGGLVQMIALVGAPVPAEEDALVAPGTRLIADNFAAIQPAETKLSSQFLVPDRGFESRALPAKARPVEPLAQMKVPSGSRRSYLIASATLASTTAPVLTSDRPARGLSDERLYDQISRINARGAGVNMKF